MYRVIILSVEAMSTIPGVKMCILLGSLYDILKFGPSQCGLIAI